MRGTQRQPGRQCYFIDPCKAQQSSNLKQSYARTGAHSTSALKAAAIVRRSTDTNGAVYWISALLRTCAAGHLSSGSPHSLACIAQRMIMQRSAEVRC